MAMQGQTSLPVQLSPLRAPPAVTGQAFTGRYNLADDQPCPGMGKKFRLAG